MTPSAWLPEESASAMFTVQSPGLVPGGELLAPNYSVRTGRPGSADVSPRLSWSGAPPHTRSYAATVFDPDAAGGAGFWHWIVAGIPASVHHLDENAGDADGARLPQGVQRFANGAGIPAFVGAAPPVGDAPHRYVFTVYALDTDQLPLLDDASIPELLDALNTHALDRAELVVHGQVT